MFSKALVPKAIVARSVLTIAVIALSKDLSKLLLKASTKFLLTCELNLGTNKAFCSAILLTIFFVLVNFYFLKYLRKLLYLMLYQIY